MWGKNGAWAALSKYRNPGRAAQPPALAVRGRGAALVAPRYFLVRICAVELTAANGTGKPRGQRPIGAYSTVFSVVFDMPSATRQAQGVPGAHPAAQGGTGEAASPPGGAGRKLDTQLDSTRHNRGHVVKYHYSE